MDIPRYSQQSDMSIPQNQVVYASRIVRRTPMRLHLPIHRVSPLYLPMDLI